MPPSFALFMIGGTARSRWADVTHGHVRLSGDNAGVGGSTGTTPDTIEQMARDALAFMAAMQFSQADLLGFSIGSFVAQQMALIRPA